MNLRPFLAIAALTTIAGCATPAPERSATSTDERRPPSSGKTRVAATTLSTNAAAIAIIKKSEGLRLDAYSDGVRWLIGYGHTATARKGMRITEATADALLKQDLAACEKTIAKIVTVPVTANEFGAMASFCYNLGTGGYSKSSIVARLNSKDYAGAADAFLAYTKGTMNGVKQEIPHLKTRREQERALFLAR